jgi:hypothetical protein
MEDSVVSSLLNNLRQVANTISIIAETKSTRDLDKDQFEDLHREEFRLAMEESRLRRKIEKELAQLESKPEYKFYVNRVRKSLNTEYL